MSAEYSVEEVKLKRREHVAETSLYAMLTDLLKRIEADESAALDGVVPTVVSAACDAYTSKDPREQTVNRACMRAALLAVWPNPPAQAAQVDCPTCGGVDLSDLGVECVRCTSASTHPHSPDAADSGRLALNSEDVSDLFGLIRTLENLSKKRAPDPTDLDGEFFVTANINHAVKSATYWLPIVKRIYARAYEALAAQGQSAASPVGVPDGWVLRETNGGIVMKHARWGNYVVWSQVDKPFFEFLNDLIAAAPPKEK